MSIEKNKKIKQTLAETHKRRESQKCFVFKTKINKQKLNAVQREQLNRLFLEAKWFYNHSINFMQTHKLSELDTKVKSVTILDKNKQPVDRKFTALKSSYKQGIKDKLGDSLNALHQLKLNGHKVGRLKFKNNLIELDKTVCSIYFKNSNMKNEYTKTIIDYGQQYFRKK